jgi:hypothetical protein
MPCTVTKRDYREISACAGAVLVGRLEREKFDAKVLFCLFNLGRGLGWEAACEL